MHPGARPGGIGEAGAVDLAPSSPGTGAPPLSPISVERARDGTTLVLRGEIDVRDTALLRSVGTTAVDAGLPVTLDCTDLTFLDSSALSLFARLIKAGHPVRIVGARPHLRSLLSRTGLGTLVRVEG